MEDVAQQLGIQLAQKRLTLVTAESCTGGWISKLVTDIPGSSAWFDRGFVTYSNQAKVETLGVSEEIINKHGAVSEQAALEMARGALHHSAANISIAVSGIAGPGGGSREKPVGFVCFAWLQLSGFERAESICFEGDREQIRFQAAHYVLHRLLELLND